jgi:hypothetical protein
MSSSKDKAPELAERIYAWNEAGTDGLTMAMRLGNVNAKTYRRAMKIVHKMIEDQVTREVDAEAALRGRYATENELQALREKLATEGPPGLTAADLARLEAISKEVIRSIRNDYPNLIDGEMAERIFRTRMAARALQ